ncbi:hypothetical protein [Xanthobacter autotrophicus]|uniref:hypothetical protein n=1 Tax=Xanthobacter autotrophicus TaxID=280 RepID=UPI00372B3753
MALFEAEMRLTGQLLPGERILWAGQPKQGIVFTRGDIYTTFFFLLWGGIPAFGLFSLPSDGPALFNLVAAPFIIIAVYMLVGRYFYDAWSRKLTFYAVTDRRVLMWNERGKGRFVALDRAHIGAVTLDGNREQGTILFGPEKEGLKFLGIANAGEVFDLVQRPLPAGR